LFKTVITLKKQKKNHLQSLSPNQLNINRWNQKKKTNKIAFSLLLTLSKISNCLWNDDEAPEVKLLKWFFYKKNLDPR